MSEAESLSKVYQNIENSSNPAFFYVLLPNQYAMSSGNSSISNSVTLATIEAAL